MEAEVFEQEGLAGFEAGDKFLGNLADAVRGEGHVLILGEDLVEKLAEAVHNGAQAHGGHDLAFGATEV